MGSPAWSGLNPKEKKEAVEHYAGLRTKEKGEANAFLDVIVRGLVLEERALPVLRNLVLEERALPVPGGPVLVVCALPAPGGLTCMNLSMVKLPRCPNLWGMP